MHKVIVRDIGYAYFGDDKVKAREAYDKFMFASALGKGKARAVSWFVDGELVAKYEPSEEDRKTAE